MHSIRKIAALIARVVFVLVLLAVALLLLPRQAMDFTNSHAEPQEQGRIVSRKPWRVEPVKVVAARNKKKEKIDIDKVFDDDEDWLDGFTVTVVNNSDKTVTAMNVEMVFRREPGDSRPPAAISLYFGPSPSSLEYLRRDPNKVIKPGKTGELTLSPENYESLIRLLQQAGYPASMKRVELEISEVGFEDGSVLQAGTLFLPDPKHPNDPTKKIREVKKFQHHRTNPQGLKGNRQVSFSKASLTLPPNPAECYAQDYSPWNDCVLGCHIRLNLVDDFQQGTFTTEERMENCTMTLFDGEHNCGQITQVPRFVQCTIPCGEAYQTCVTPDDCCSGLFCDGGQCTDCEVNPQDPHGGCMSQNCASCYANGGTYCTGEGGNCWTPIILDIQGHGFDLTNASNGVNFDLDADGAAEQVAWTEASSAGAFLALDRNGDGSINNGKELFGNFADQSASSDPNGFRALAEFDKPANGGNRDLIIDSRDAVFPSLRLWQDLNHNGVSELNELHSLAELNVESISVDFKTSGRHDRWGNTFRYRAKVYGTKHSDLGRWAYDVMLLHSPTPIQARNSSTKAGPGPLWTIGIFRPSAPRPLGQIEVKVAGEPLLSQVSAPSSLLW